MGKFYTQLSIEERTMIPTQLAMGIKASAIARDWGAVHRRCRVNFIAMAGFVRKRLVVLDGLRRLGVIVLKQRICEPVIAP